MKRFIPLLLVALAALRIAPAQPLDSLCTKTEHRIAMRDGVRLHTTVYAPRSAEPAPILIFRTPYGCAPYGPGRFPSSLEEGYLRTYLDRGYILVLQDVRGRYMSEGEFVNVRPAAGKGAVDETTDSYDTVEWLVCHVPHNNGRVGFAGSSYPGFYALMGALCGHPAVRAVSPQAPVVDWFMGDDTHHNGVLMLTDSYRFIPGMSRPGKHTPAERMPSRGQPTCPEGMTEYEFFLRIATLDSLSRMLPPTPFWEEMAAHPDYDAWWQARDVRQRCRDIRPAVLIVGGTYDAEDCYGTWNLYRTIRSQSPATTCRLVIGPWSHGAWRSGDGRLGPFDFGVEASGRYYVEHFELPFFEHWLRGREEVRDSLPSDSEAVRVYVPGRNEWQGFDRRITRGDPLPARGRSARHAAPHGPPLAKQLPLRPERPGALHGAARPQTRQALHGGRPTLHRRPPRRAHLRLGAAGRGADARRPRRGDAQCDALDHRRRLRRPPL